MGEPVRSLRVEAPWRVLDGFGRAVRAASRFATPRDATELVKVLEAARTDGLTVAFRGSGRSYGDAALNTSQLVVDTTSMNRMLNWDPVSGILEAEPGLTIEGIWRRTLEDGYWPAVVSGTMAPTLGGCLSMNIHGKNNFKAGPFGEHVLDFDLVTPEGSLIKCSRDENADVFHAAIGGLGLLGAFTRVRLRLKKVESGFLRVTPSTGRNLEEMFDLFEEQLPSADYLVGWVDCLASGKSLGRGEIHRANYIVAAEDPCGPESFHTESQILPSKILGLPKAQLWRFMRPFLNNFGVRWVNMAKYHSARLKSHDPYLQPHVAFAFLLDYVPNWRLAYGAGGFIQYQVFVPKESARQTLGDLLRMCQSSGYPSYLGVLKRHRPDSFLLTHAVDGYSLAMDFRVTDRNKSAIWALAQKMTERVLDAGGRFYFAKDAVLSQADASRFYGKSRLDAFFNIKSRLDPNGVLQSDLSRRIFGRQQIPGQMRILENNE